MRQDGACLGERVLFCKLIRDTVLQHFNPWKLNDLRYVLEMRCFKGLLSDTDLKEVYFEKMWGFGEGDFVPAKWREMSVDEARQILAPWQAGGSHAVGSLSKEDIMRQYENVLESVPEAVFWSAARGALVLRELKLRGVAGIVSASSAWKYIIWACEAELDVSVICTLADRSERLHLALARRGIAAAGGSSHRACNSIMLDLLSSIYYFRLQTLVL
jgi:hypothetical protein